MGRPIILESWIPDAIEFMVRTGCSLMDAAMEQGVEVTILECKNIERRASYNALLWQTRHRYNQQIGSDPNFGKESVIGKLLNLAQSLEAESEYDKASEVYFKIAKMQGYVGPESTISVFGELSQKDMDAIRKKITEDAKSIRPN